MKIWALAIGIVLIIIGVIAASIGIVEMMAIDFDYWFDIIGSSSFFLFFFIGVIPLILGIAISMGAIKK